MDGSGQTGQPITDPLTGAYSRALLTPRLTEELSRVSRSNTGCAVFLFDVDYFKSVNDAYGHARGDEVLVELAARVGSLVRGYDVLFRYGGDEFVLLLPDTTKPDAIRVALRLAEGIRSRPFSGEPPLTVSVSLGVATYPDDAADPAALLACADRRNYLAKQRGRAGAVADDVPSGARGASSRLVERDAQLAAAHQFLTRLAAERRGCLRVVGEAGAGHSRFLEAVAHAARLRGFAVQAPPGGAAARPEPGGTDWAAPPAGLTAEAAARPPAGLPAEAAASLPATRLPAAVLIVADRAGGDAPEPPGWEAVAEAMATAPVDLPVGLVFATTHPAEQPLPAAVAPVLETVELPAWSPAGLRVWLRTTLAGEPSRALTAWLSCRSEQLPARAERELTRLADRGGLARTPTGGWSLAPQLLARAGRLPYRLPIPLTEFVGRQKEIAQLAQLLAERRLVTLVGAGGIGKTRLALAAGTVVAERFDDGAAFVSLAEVETGDQLVAALGRALAVPAVPGQRLLETVTGHLAERALLLILDNFERALASAPLVSDLLAAAPEVTVLATSRERLGLRAEQVFAVPPLPLPDPGRLPAGAAGLAAALASSPALALLQARARAAAFGFALTPEQLPAAIELCRRLDGLPLAIELAGARCDTLTPEQLLAELRERLDLPGPGPRDLPSRQQTLHATIGWSYDLLDAQGQRLFRWLGGFPAGCLLDAVVAVCLPEPGGHPGGGLADRLGRLADRSLILIETDAGGTRYGMLHTIRAFALERLVSSGEYEEAMGRHAAHYAMLAARAERELTGADQSRWAALIQRDYPNLRGAFGWALEHGDEATAAHIGLGLWRYWRTGDHLDEGRQWLGRLLRLDPPLPARTRARVLHAAAVLAGAQDDHEAAAELAGDSLRLARTSADESTVAQACNALGIAALAAGDYPAARRFFGESLEIWQELDAPLGMAIAHGNLTKVALRTGDVARARAHADRCLALDTAQGNTRGVMLGLLCLGEIHLGQGDADACRERAGEALAIARTLGDVFGEAMALHLLGLAAGRAGDRTEALRRVTDAALLRRDVGDREDLAISLDELAGLLAADRPRLAVRLLAAADALRAQYRLPAPTGQHARTEALAGICSTLDSDEIVAAREEGRCGSLDALLDEVVARVAGLAGAGGG